MSSNPSAPPFRRLVKFVTREGDSRPGQVLLGEPVDPEIDVGQALAEGKEVRVNVLHGLDVLGKIEGPTGDQATIERLCPLFASDPITGEGGSAPGTIRCIGLNYITHAKEVGLDIPTVPTLFMKPETALSYHGDPIVVPKSFVNDDAADYEAEVAVILGKTCKNVSEQEAMDYVLG